MAANDTQVGGRHYKSQKIQHWDYIIANDIPYLEAQIIKYVSRHARKNGLEDLGKALHFLEKLIEVETDKLNLLKDIMDPQTCDYNPNQDR
jgi:Protein of unknwon function (DUF3310)